MGVRFYLGPWMCFDLWELELRVVRVHFTDLISCGCSKNLSRQTETTEECWIEKATFVKHTEFMKMQHYIQIQMHVFV